MSDEFPGGVFLFALSLLSLVFFSFLMGMMLA